MSGRVPFHLYRDIDLYAYPCTYCRAEPGERCINKHRAPTRPHQRRIQHAMHAEEQRRYRAKLARQAD